MAYEIDGKVYRNLQEQVAENTKHINELAYGDVYLGPYLSTDAIPESQLIKGNIFLIGKVEDGYDMMRCLETGTRLFQNLGKFGAQGPKGDKGDKGETGEQGGIGNEGPKGETGNGILRVFLDQVIGQEKHYVIEFTNGDRFSYVVSDGQQGIQGPVGPAGPQGPEGPVGPQGPQGLTRSPIYEHLIVLSINPLNSISYMVNFRLLLNSEDFIGSYDKLLSVLKEWFSNHNTNWGIPASGYYENFNHTPNDIRPIDAIKVNKETDKIEFDVGGWFFIEPPQSSDDDFNIWDVVTPLNPPIE